jgi:2-C-methyl-D-erythritol 4-phosphate cytidylyltransferase
VPKSFVPLSGRPMLEWSLRAIAACPSIDGVVLMVPPGFEGDAHRLLAGLERGPRVEAVAPGGDTRQESVRLGLELVGPMTERVVCHDAARPLASPVLFGSVLDAVDTADGADGSQGAIPVVRAADTVKRLSPDGTILETIPREHVGLAQTPQGFLTVALRDAHRRAVTDGLEATDDAMLLEAAGYRVVWVEGEPANFKLTVPDDLTRAERLLTSRQEADPRADG